MLPSVIEENVRKKSRCSNGRGFGHAPNTTFFEMLYARRFILDGTAEKMIFAAQTLANPPGPSKPGDTNGHDGWPSFVASSEFVHCFLTV